MTLLLISLFAVSLSTFVQFSNRLSVNVIVRRYISALLLSVPVCAHAIFIGDVESIGATISTAGKTIFFAALFSSIAIGMNTCIAGREENIKYYPQLRHAEWTFGIFSSNALSWIIYLLAYEMFFRGYLQFISIDLFGFWFAIIINTLIYAATHLPKSIKETLLSLPFGVLLFLITWYTQNFWSAVCIHICLALSNDYFAIRANPTMTLSLFASLKKTKS